MMNSSEKTTRTAPELQAPKRAAYHGKLSTNERFSFVKLINQDREYLLVDVTIFADENDEEGIMATELYLPKHAVSWIASLKLKSKDIKAVTTKGALFNGKLASGEIFQCMQLENKTREYVAFDATIFSGDQEAVGEFCTELVIPKYNVIWIAYTGDPISRTAVRQ